MQPRTVLIVIVLMFLAAFALRFAVVRYGWLPVSEEAVLKHATAITVAYTHRNANKFLRIDDPAEVRALLAALHVQRDDAHGVYWSARLPAATIGFHFSSGHYRTHNMDGPNVLGGYQVDRAFYDKLNEIVSRKEGEPVDILARPWNNPVPLKGQIQPKGQNPIGNDDD